MKFYGFVNSCDCICHLKIMLRFEHPKNCYEDEIEHQRRNFYNGRSRYVEDNLYYRRERSHRCKDDDMYCRKERSCKQNADLNYGEKQSQEYRDDTSDYKKLRGEISQALQRIEKGWERLFESYVEKLNQQKEENKELHVFSVEPRESIDEKKVEVVSDDDDLEIVKEEGVIELKPNSDVVEYKGMEDDVADEIPQEVMKVIDEDDTGEESAGNGEDPPSLVMGGDGINISMNLQVPKLTPLIVASDVAEVFRYSYVHLPTFHSLYHDALMGLSSMSNYCNCIFPVKCYGIFMGVHWSIVDGYLYWRSVLFVQGVIVEWLAIFARHDPRLPNIRCCVEPLHESSYSDIDVSGTIVNRYLNCVAEVGVNCLYGKYVDHVEG